VSEYSKETSEAMELESESTSMSKGEPEEEMGRTLQARGKVGRPKGTGMSVEGSSSNGVGKRTGATEVRGACTMEVLGSEAVETEVPELGTVVPMRVNGAEVRTEVRGTDSTSK
jgi:hypothetical protein